MDFMLYRFCIEDNRENSLRKFIQPVAGIFCTELNFNEIGGFLVFREKSSLEPFNFIKMLYPVSIQSLV